MLLTMPASQCVVWACYWETWVESLAVFLGKSQDCFIDEHLPLGDARGFGH